MIPIIDLIGRTPDTIDRLIGEPHNKEVTVLAGIISGLKAYYLNGRLDIVYIDNVADWITVFDIDSPIVDDFVKILGLRPTKVNFKYHGKMSYYKIHGLKELMMYGNEEGKIWMLQIKAFTS
jgi:hypothetical protein